MLRRKLRRLYNRIRMVKEKKNEKRNKENIK